MYYRELNIPTAALDIAKAKNFELAGYSMVDNAASEDTRPRMVVRIGAIQNQIVLPTDRPVTEQVSCKALPHQICSVNNMPAFSCV